jgi:anti-sigma factor ChrR (cupin superfamily)
MSGEKLPAETIPDSTYVDVATVPWKKQRFPGIEVKLLMENKATGLSTALFRWAPGARLPDHQHAAIEQTYVLEGSFADGDGVYTAGNYVWRRAGSRHEAWSDEGCVTLAIFLKPNTFFD